MTRELAGGVLHHQPQRRRCPGLAPPEVDAKAVGDVAMLLLLDVQSAFDQLPHIAIEVGLDHLGISGCLQGFVTAFLSGRSLRVRVGQVLSEPGDIASGASLKGRW